MAKKKPDLGTCTAIRKGNKPCTNDADRPRVRHVHDAPVCYTCWKRLRRQNTIVCSEPECGNLIMPNIREERTKPQPWCREHEHQALQSHVIGEAERQRVREDFLQKIQSDWETGCWNWTGHASGGYGIYKGRKTVGTWKAHRLAWHLFNEGHQRHQVIDHRCANGLCVNPLHLQPETEDGNTQLRDERRKDPNHVWHNNQSVSIFLPLLAFATLNDLVFRTADTDYSKSYGVCFQDGLANVATILRARRADPPHPPAHPKQLGNLKQRGISEKTLKDLDLTQEEAQKLLRPRRIKPRRSRRLTVS